MKKIYLDFPMHIYAAIEFNLVGTEYELRKEMLDSDMQLSISDFADGKLRIGVVLDKIFRDFGSSFMAGKVEFNIKKQTASSGDIEVKLTEKEILLIAKLAEHNGYTTRAEILQDVWGYAEDTATRTVESHVHRLNQKMEEEFGIKLVEQKGGAYKLSL